MNKLDFLDSLCKNNSILLNQYAKNWKDGIQKCFEPLLLSKAINQNYIDGVINNTLKYGPYYIIAPKLAMPHFEANKEFVYKDSFSLLTFKEPVFFDEKPIYILIGLAASCKDVHMSIALPQIVAIFENPEIVDKIINSKSKKEVIEIIKSINYFKYIS